MNRMSYQSHLVGTPIPTLDVLQTGTAPFDPTGRGWRQLQMPLMFDVVAFP